MHTETVTKRFLYILLVLLSAENAECQCNQKNFQVFVHQGIQQAFATEVLSVENLVLGDVEIVDDLPPKAKAYIDISITSESAKLSSSVQTSVTRRRDQIILIKIFQNPKLPSTSARCVLKARVTLHMHEGFLRPGSRVILHKKSTLVYENWVKINSNSPIIVNRYDDNNPVQQRDRCSENLLKPCDHCRMETGSCYCPPGYQQDSIYKNYCHLTKSASQRTWTDSHFKSGFDIVTGQTRRNVFRYTYNSARTNSRGDHIFLAPNEIKLDALSKCTSDTQSRSQLITQFTEIRNTQRASLKIDGLKGLIDSFGPLRDCTKNNGDCPSQTKCISDRFLNTAGCVCPVNLVLLKNNAGCYDPKKSIDCSDGYNGGCEHQCLSTTKLIGQANSTHMACGCKDGYRLKADGRSCEFLHACNKQYKGGCAPRVKPNLGECVTNTSDPQGAAQCVCNDAEARNVEICRENIAAGACALGRCVQKPQVACTVKGSGGQCYRVPTKVFQTFRLGFDWKTQKLTKTGLFELTYGTNYEFSPKVIPDEVNAEEFSEQGGCEYKESEIQSYENTMSHLEMIDSETKGGSVGFQLDFSVPIGPVTINSGVGFSNSWSESRFERKKQSYQKQGFTKTQTIKVLNEHFGVKWKNGQRKMLPGLKAAIGRLRVNNRQTFIDFFKKYGTHFFEEIIYGYESKYVLHYSSNSTYTDMQQFYQKETTSRKSVNILGFSKSSFKNNKEVRDSSIARSISNGKLSIDWSEKGACPAACDKCESDDDADTLAIVKTKNVSPMEKLIVGNPVLQQTMHLSRLSYLWCNGQGDVLGGILCQCDSVTPDCSPLRPPSPAAAGNTDSSIQIEWKNTQQLIGSHVVNYELVIIEKKYDRDIDPFTVAPTNSIISFNNDKTFMRTATFVCDRTKYFRGEMNVNKNGMFRVSVECLKPDTEYRIGVRTVGVGKKSEAGVFNTKTGCDVINDAEIQSSFQAVFGNYYPYWLWWGSYRHFSTLLGYSPLRLALMDQWYNTRHGAGKFDDLLKNSFGKGGKRQVRDRIASVPARCKLYVSRTKYIIKTLKKRVSKCYMDVVSANRGYRKEARTTISNNCQPLDVLYEKYTATGA